MSTRDTQRQKVYDAEIRAFGESYDGLSVPQMQALVDKWGESKVLRRHYPRAARLVEVTDGRSRRRGQYSPRLYEASKIKMPRFTRCKWYLLHEYVHHLTRTHHDWRFCEAYLMLVRVFMSKGSEEVLKTEFKAGRVKHRPPVKRTMTSAQREAARERMQALNAAKRAA